MNPVTYAEQELGVHIPWQEAQDRLASHENATNTVTHFKNLLRMSKDYLEDAKREARAEAPSQIQFFDSLSVKERDQAVRDFIANSPKVTSVEQDIRSFQGDLDRAEGELKHHELGLKVLSSRMTELGGLLHFYAEVKRAETEESVIKSNTSDKSVRPRIGENT